MLLYKKICICIILIVLSCTLYLLFQKRQELLKEGMTDNSGIDYEIKKMVFEPTGISSLSKSTSSQMLKQYCIKSSYNSALSGKYVSTDAIKRVLSRGCRFLDFEVFLIDDDAQVAFSDDPTFVTVKSNNSITLNSALQTIISNAFSAPSPNSDDPIFIQLRIKSKSSNIYNLIGMAIKNYLSNKLYKGKVTGNTPLYSLMGKVVLIIDTTLSPNYSTNDLYPKCTPNNVVGELNTTDDCVNLSKFVNIESGTSNLRRYTYKSLLGQMTTPPILIDSEHSETDVMLFRLVCPDDNDTSNPNYEEFLNNYGVQFISFKFYVTDTELKKYEHFFSVHKSAFVPLSTAIVNSFI